MEFPSKETVKQDAELVAAFYLAATDKGIHPERAATMAMYYLAMVKSGGMPKEPWQ